VGHPSGAGSCVLSKVNGHLTLYFEEGYTPPEKNIRKDEQNFIPKLKKHFPEENQVLKKVDESN